MKLHNLANIGGWIGLAAISLSEKIVTPNIAYKKNASSTNLSHINSKRQHIAHNPHSRQQAISDFEQFTPMFTSSCSSLERNMAKKPKAIENNRNRQKLTSAP